MGGTTAKICLLSDGEPERARKFEIARAYRDMKGSGLPVRIPVIEMVEIGAGGGSIARVDKLEPHHRRARQRRFDARPRLLRPWRHRACRHRCQSGTWAKSIPPILPAARSSLMRPAPNWRCRQPSATPLGLKDFWPAAGVTEIVEENMANAARVHAIERGRDIAAMHHDRLWRWRSPACLPACRKGRRENRIIVPMGAGVGSAIGFLRAPIAYEVTRSAAVALAAFDAKPGEQTCCKRMSVDARAVVEPALGKDKGSRVHTHCRLPLCRAGP